MGACEWNGFRLSGWFTLDVHSVLESLHHVDVGR
jgi:hypothetical protein